jgi:DNA-binding MarR family transcriptional regulator
MLHANAALAAILGDELEREHGLPIAWYDVLLKLNEAGGRMRMHELAEAVLLSKSGLSRLVDRMAVARLVCREQCPSDRRGFLAVLTPEGKSALQKAAPTHLRGIDAHFASMVDEREAAVLREVSDRLLAHVRGLGCAPAEDD